jgi:hypothetical protein
MDGNIGHIVILTLAVWDLAIVYASGPHRETMTKSTWHRLAKGVGRLSIKKFAALFS